MASSSTDHHDLLHHLESLDIPTEYNKYDRIFDPENKNVLDAWARDAPRRLESVRSVVTAANESYTVQEYAMVVAKVAPFAFALATLNEVEGRGSYEEESNVLRDEAPWIVLDSQTIATDILKRLDPARKPAIVKQILEHVIKPIFRASNPHPHINTATGRTIPQSKIGRAPQQGGMSSVTQDFYDTEGQKWKDSIGLGAVVYWCIDNIDPEMYIELWYLIVPPLMTLLDDYQPRYKLWGLFIARRMLQDVSPSLLQRTGLQELLRESLKRTTAHQDTPLSPTIIRLAISQSLRLILMTTAEGSQSRFDALCDLLGDGIITNIWTYTFDKPEVVRATLEALPPLLKALDIGCTRFIQSLLVQLVHPLVLPSNQGDLPGQRSLDLLQVQMQVAALRPLVALIHFCAPRIYSWRLTILDALVRSWVIMVSNREHKISTIDASPYTVQPQKSGADSDDEDMQADDSPVATEMVDYDEEYPTNPSNMKQNLQVLVHLLQKATFQLFQCCPSLSKIEGPQLLEKDPGLAGLLPRITATVESRE